MKSSAAGGRLDRLASGVALALALLVSIAVIVSGNVALVNATGFEHSRHCLYLLMSQGLPEREVLIVGSSRMRHAIDPNRLAVALGVASEKVLNVSHPEEDLGLDAGLIDRISNQEQIKLVVVAVHLPSLAPQDFASRAAPMPYNAPLRLVSRDYLDQTVLVLRYGDLLADARGQGGVASIYDGINLVERKIDRTIKLFGGSAILSTKLHADPLDDPTWDNVCFPVEASRPERQAFKSGAAKPWLEPDWKRVPADALTSRPEILLGSEPAQPGRAAIERIVRIGRERGFRAMFVYLPSVEAPDTAARLAPAFATRFGAPLVVPPRAIMPVAHYSDVHHLNLAGRAAVTDWLAREIQMTGGPAQ